MAWSLKRLLGKEEVRDDAVWVCCPDASYSIWQFTVMYILIEKAGENGPYAVPAPDSSRMSPSFGTIESFHISSSLFPSAPSSTSLPSELSSDSAIFRIALISGGLSDS